MSHPEWVRGLKHSLLGNLITKNLSHPEWVRGLKLICTAPFLGGLLSHPEWVRGLKHRQARHQRQPY